MALRLYGLGAFWAGVNLLGMIEYKMYDSLKFYDSIKLLLVIREKKLSDKEILIDSYYVQ